MYFFYLTSVQLCTILTKKFTFKSLITDWTRVNTTLLLSEILMYVEVLHKRTHVTAAASQSCLLAACGTSAFLTLSTNCR